MCYQNFKNYEIIIADGGSNDQTLSIAKKYHAKVFKNPLKTAEAGKTMGVNHAHGKYIALIDSDNILPTKNSTIFFKVDSNQHVEILQRKNGFIKVLGLDNDFIGWIKEDSFGTN